MTDNITDNREDDNQRHGIEEKHNGTNTSETELTKLSIERQKLEIEMQKLKIEKSKLFYSSLIGTIPLLAVVSTIFYGIWTQRQQEKTQFQLKAAEIMFNSTDAYEMKGKANILRIILNDKLPPNFAQAFNPYSLGFYDRYQVNAKIELLKLLSSKTSNKEEVVEFWRKAFPDDAWADTLRTK